MTTKVDYSIGEIKDEARQLIATGKINSHQPIYVLCQFIPRENGFVLNVS